MVTPLRPPRRPLAVADAPVFVWQRMRRGVRVYHEHPHQAAAPFRTRGPVARFDPHTPDRHGRPREQPDGRGVVYLADELECALAEALPDQPCEVLVCPGLRATLVYPLGHVHLLDLSGSGAMRIGAVGTLAWGDEPRELTQQWARAIYEDLSHLQGIRYRSAHQGGLAIAAWDRSRPLLRMDSRSDRALVEPGMRNRVTVALANQGRALVEVGASDCRACRELTVGR